MISKKHQKFLLKYIRKAKLSSFVFVIFLMLSSVLAEATFLKSLQNIVLSIQSGDFYLISKNTLYSLVLVVVTGSLKVFQLRYYVRYSANIGKLICRDTLTGYFGENLDKTRKLNSNDLINSIIVQANYVTNGVILSFLNLINNGLVSIGIIFILVSNLGLGIILLILFMLFTYVIIAKVNKKKYELISKKQVTFINKLTKNLLYLVNNKKRVFLNRSNPNLFKATFSLDSNYRNFLANTKELLIYPKFLVETLSIAMLLLFLLFLSGKGDQFIVSKMGLLFFGVLRILPNFQTIYYGWGQIKSNSSQIDAFLNYENKIIFDKVQVGSKHKIEKIEIFNNSKKLLTINKGDFICINGKSGSGKTTFLNILCNLHKVDEIEIFYRNSRGQLLDCDYTKSQISFVEQDVYLQDDTVKNIILNNSIKTIKFNKKNQIYEIANLNEILLSDFWDKVCIGASGGNLSGGQKQRVAIAEALAWEPSILILDEATAGIDSKTEQKIWNSLRKIKDLTIIAVTHKEKLHNQFDKVIEIEDLNLKKK